MKIIVIYLSLKPEEGGKFQYSLNILAALTQLNGKEFAVRAVTTEKIWEEYLNIPYIFIENKYSWFEKKLKSLVLKKLKSIFVWRFIGKYFDPIQRVLFSLKPDIIVYPGNDALAYECAIPSAIPIFDLMHKYESWFPEVSDKVIYRQREFHYKNICRYAKFILVDSELGKKHVLECYQVEEKKIKVLPYIAPSYVFGEIDTAILEKYNLPAEFIFYPAQFWAHKNHKIILEALHKLKEEQNMIVNAVFVGAPKNNYHEVIKMINELKLEKQIKNLGYVSNKELVALYKKAKALVFPSHFGPTNIPPLEALALGCPVIVSDVYAHREQLKGNAEYFNPDDPIDLAGRILSLYRKEASFFNDGHCEKNSKIVTTSLISYAESMDMIFRDN